MEKIIKTIKTLLGEPVTAVELTDEQIEESYKNAEKSFFLFKTKVITMGLDEAKKFKEYWIEEYTIQNCKEILGIIRGKFKGNLNIPIEGNVQLEYVYFLNDSNEKKQRLIKLIQ